MTNLPVIVGFGGYNAAGRSSFHHGYRRTVLGSLSPEKQQSTLASLAVLMGLARRVDEQTGDRQHEALGLCCSDLLPSVRRVRADGAGRDTVPAPAARQV